MAERLVLVTGGSGYVGSVLVPLLARDFKVRVVETMNFGNPIAGLSDVEFIQADVQDETAMQRAMVGVTDVIHLAGIVTDELVDMNPVKAMRVNLLGTMNVARAACEAGAKRLIYASSSSVYGAQDIVCTEETPPKPQTIYAATKLVGEDIVNQFKDMMTVVSVRCATCCGPAPRMRLDTIVNIFSAQAFFEGIITVHGGYQYRTNVHVDDAAELYRFLLDAPREIINGNAYNLAAEFQRAEDIGRTVQKATTGFVPRIGTLLEPSATLMIDRDKHDPRSYRMDASRLALELAWTPSRTIVDAVRDNIRWFQQGHIEDWRNDLYHNTRRMAEVMHAPN